MGSFELSFKGGIGPYKIYDGNEEVGEVTDSLLADNGIFTIAGNGKLSVGDHILKVEDKYGQSVLYSEIKIL